MKKYIFGITGLLVLGALYYAASPLFNNSRLDEQVPGEEITNTGTEERALEATAKSTDPVAIVDTPAHPASGAARIVTSTDTQYLRYENFKTINGPDLYVYLSKDKDAQEFVDLGKLKATEGNVNYEIPQGIDPREYPYALVWCKAFGVLFNSAKLY